ncbi:MAG TPA: rhomboid family intramembrane serine protease [Mucilaginibacter sp.]|jgi:rhomboid-like protein|nr:rhomboid family intramembrane serine protease [Mucilaginibacter sp.]
MSQYRQSPFANITPVVKNLLIINFLFFAATFVLHNSFDMYKWLSVYYFDSPQFRPWQLITYMFMHANFMHIFFNMFGLFMFGPILEYSMGSKKFFNLYFICGIGGVALQLLVQAIEVHAITGGFTIAHPELESSFLQYGSNAQKLFDIYNSQLVGASGAIFGILVAFGVLYPNMELFIFFIPIPIKAKYIVSAYILYEIYATFNQASGDNVAHLAHLGGGLFGFLLIKLWGIRGNNYH